MAKSAVLVAIAIASSACSSMSDVVLPRHPCANVSATDVSRIVGGPVAAGKETMDSHGATCSFDATGSFALPGAPTINGAPPGLVGSITIRFLDAAAYKDAQARSHAAMPGFGDHAFELQGPHLAELFVAKARDRMVFDVHVGLGEAFAPEEQLAAIVVPRL